MKAVLALLAVCAVFALSQAAAVQSVNDCQITKIIEMVGDIVSDSFTLKAEIQAVIPELEKGVIKCVVSSLSQLQTCITEVVQSTVSTLEDDVETYLSDVKDLANNIEDALKECV